MDDLGGKTTIFGNTQIYEPMAYYRPNKTTG